MPVGAKLAVSLSVSQTGSAAFSATPYWSAAMVLEQLFGSGTTAGNIDLAYVGERTVTTGANDDIDLAGVLADAMGVTIVAVEIVGILVINKQKNGIANTTNLTVGAGSNPLVGYLGGTLPTVGPIRPGGVFLMMNPDASGIAPVTAGTGDVLRISNSAGASNVYQIAVIARSA